MKTNIPFILLLLFAQLVPIKAQEPKADSTWNLQYCISQALEKNIQVQKSVLTSEVNELTVKQSKASRFPSVSASVGQNFSWDKSLNATTNQYGSYEGSNSTSYGINSSVTLYNGFKTQNTIKQSSVNYEAGKYNTETTREEISLSVLKAYLQVLYSQEQVKNAQKQVESTTDQMRLAEERQRLGVISKADYLQVKSQLASEKSTLANAEKTLAINKLTLLQLMEMPASTSFTLVVPDSSQSILQYRQPQADSVYTKALGIKPQIKSAQLNVESAQIDVDIAKASYQPTLTLSGGVNTGYSSGLSGLAYDYQVKNRISPTVGLSLSIPIYQNLQAKTKVATAKVGVKTAELTELNTRNELRKAIEQACVDVTSYEKAFEAGMEEYYSAQESFAVAEEKFNNGMINSVDFLIQKTNLISAESSLLQAKYNLLFSYKTLDFYTGTPLTF
jgi:outer membrane protein